MLYNKDWEIKLSPAAELLHKCADHFKNVGWCQFNVGNKGVPMCSVGALHFLSTTSEQRDLARQALITQIDDKDGLVAWNNREERTKEEVIATFRAAAATV